MALGIGLPARGAGVAWRLAAALALLATLLAGAAGAPERAAAAIVFSYYSTPTAGSNPDGIVAGPDGALWFTEHNVNKIGRITATGAITEYALPETNRYPTDIAAGRDGALWFTEAEI